MTRDIFETNGFVVVVEYSSADKPVISTCEVSERTVGFAFYGSGDVQLEMNAVPSRILQHDQWYGDFVLWK